VKLRNMKGTNDKEGVRHLKSALELAPTGLPGLHRRLANALQTRVRRDASDRFSYKEALDAYKAGLRLDADDRDAYHQLGRLHALRDGKDAMGKSVEGYHHSKHVGSSEDVVTSLWRSAIKIEPDTCCAVQLDLSSRLSQSSRKKQRKEAVELAHAAVDHEPHKATSHAALAAAHMRTHKPLPLGPIGQEDARALPVGAARTSAHKALERAIKCTQLKGSPQVHAEAYYQLGMLLHATTAERVPLQRMQAAHYHFQVALKLQPDNTDYENAEASLRRGLSTVERVPTQPDDADDDDE